MQSGYLLHSSAGHVFLISTSIAQVMDKYFWHLPYGSVPTICCVQQQRRRKWERRIKRVSCGKCSTAPCIKWQNRCGSAADLPGLRNGWAWAVMPQLLSLIHVTQDNMHRSHSGRHQGGSNTVGVSGGREDGREGWRWRPGRVQTERVVASRTQGHYIVCNYREL